MALTAKQIAGNQRRTLRKMRERLLAMSLEWEDADQFNLSQLEALADQCEEVAINITPDPKDEQ